MEQFLRVLPNTFIPLFVAIDVTWLLPIFTAYTAGMERGRSRSLLSQSLMTALLVSLSFVVSGEFIFSVLGITTSDFKVAGGLLLLVLAVMDIVTPEKPAMLSAGNSGVVPLGVPLIVGPAVLTTILVLVDHYGVLPTVAGLVLNLLLVWAALGNAHRLQKILGPGVMHGLSKIMAILLAAIAVMMIRLGLEGILSQ